MYWNYLTLDSAAFLIGGSKPAVTRTSIIQAAFGNPYQALCLPVTAVNEKNAVICLHQ